MSLDLPDFTRKMSLDVDINAPFIKNIITNNYGIISLDSLGKIIFIENFANGLSHWCKWPDTAPGAIEINTNYFSSAGYSCFMRTRDMYHIYSLLTHLIPVYNTAKVGLEFKFAFYTYPGILYASIAFNTSEGIKYMDFEYDLPAKKVRVYNQDWDEVELDLYIYDTVSVCFWQTIKAVVNLETTKLERLQYNQYNLTGLDISLPVDDTAGYEYWRLDLYAESRNYYGCRLYLDDIIITIDEP